MVANPDFVDIEKLASADSMTFVVFIFSIKIGALITYLLKEALNLKSQFLLAMIESEKDNLTDDQKYELALAWLRNCVITTLPTILYRFRENIAKVIARKHSLQQQNDAFDKFLQFMKKGSRHAFSDKVYGVVSEAFIESFPATSRDLDRMSKKLPGLMESIYGDGYIERAQPDTSIDLQTRVGARRMKKNHVHEFLPRELKNNMKYKRCRSCGYEQADPIVSRTEKADKNI